MLHHLHACIKLEFFVIVDLDLPWNFTLDFSFLYEYWYYWNFMNFPQCFAWKKSYIALILVGSDEISQAYI